MVAYQSIQVQIFVVCEHIANDRALFGRFQYVKTVVVRRVELC